MRKTHFIILLFLLPALLLGLTFCSGHSRYGERLESIDDVISQNPDSAISLLKTIPDDSLREGERKFYELLTIKANDKAYVIHESDSLINEVIDYYSRHKGDRRYAEALYYGGRVNSDLGDYPTALRFFEDALDQLPEGTENLQLRATVLSQTARLYDNIRVYDKSLHNLEKALQVDSVLKDTINIIYDKDLLAQIYQHLGEYEKAGKLFNETLHLSENFDSSLYVREKMLSASNLYHKGNYDSALMVIRTIPLEFDKKRRNLALAYAVRIYRKNEIFDTAYLYASKLLTGNNQYDKKDAYEVLLGEDLKNFVPTDSLYAYNFEYRKILEQYLNNNGKRDIFIQNSMYNYNKHERQKRNAELYNLRLRVYLAFSFIFILLLVIALIYYNYRNTKEILHLNEEINHFDSLLNDLNAKTFSNKDVIIGGEDKIVQIDNGEISVETKQNLEEESEESISRTKYNLKRKLRRRLLNMKKSTADEKPVHEEIVNSDTYKKLINDYVKNNNCIPENDPFWNELNEMVLNVHENFNSNLRLLYGDDLLEIDMHIAILIKCGITPSQLVHLIAKEKGTLSYRRRKMCSKIMGKDLGAATFDDIIYII